MVQFLCSMVKWHNLTMFDTGGSNCLGLCCFAGAGSNDKPEANTGAPRLTFFCVFYELPQELLLWNFGGQKVRSRLVDHGECMWMCDSWVKMTVIGMLANKIWTKIGILVNHNNWNLFELWPQQTGPLFLWFPGRESISSNVSFSCGKIVVFHFE